MCSPLLSSAVINVNCIGLYISSLKKATLWPWVLVSFTWVGFIDWHSRVTFVSFLPTFIKNNFYVLRGKVTLSIKGVFQRVNHWSVSVKIKLFTPVSIKSSSLSKLCYSREEHGIYITADEIIYLRPVSNKQEAPGQSSEGSSDSCGDELWEQTMTEEFKGKKTPQSFLIWTHRDPSGGRMRSRLKISVWKQWKG